MHIEGTSSSNSKLLTQCTQAVVRAFSYFRSAPSWGESHSPLPLSDNSKMTGEHPKPHLHNVLFAIWDTPNLKEKGGLVA